MRRRTAGESRPRDDDRHDAAGGEQLQALAVEGRERLERLAVGADVDAAVGEHAVDVEDRRGDAFARAARGKQQLGRERRAPARWPAIR